ncbi:MAG: sigma-70 family RNA polymerase sigma factor [Kiritimatiellae bacterium]|nr:sigma-70 family RNA polymerase sigma factor [Kiritimatiellia bacterium]
MSVLEGIKDPANQPGWERFFNMYAGYVYSIARSHGLNDADANDVLSRVMSGIVGNVDKYDPARGRFRSWLYNLTIWRIKNVWRANQARPEIPVDIDALPIIADNTPVTDDEAEWRGAVTDEALRRLQGLVNPTHFAIFHASVIEELDVDSIRRLYGVSRDNIYQIRKRIKGNFATLLADVAQEMEQMPAIAAR